MLGSEAVERIGEKRSGFRSERIAAVLRQAESGMPVADLIRQLGMSEQTFFRWKKAHGGLQPDQARELKQLHEEKRTSEAPGGRSQPGQGHPAGRGVKDVGS